MCIPLEKDMKSIIQPRGFSKAFTNVCNSHHFVKYFYISASSITTGELQVNTISDLIFIGLFELKTHKT